MSVVDPRSWSRLQYADEGAFLDFLGAHSLFHAALDSTVRRLFPAVPYANLPLGDGASERSRPEWLWGAQPQPKRQDGALDEHALATRLYPGDEWMLALQASHQGASTALLIAAPPDLTAYDLTDPDQFTTFVYLLAQDDVRLRQAAGL